MTSQHYDLRPPSSYDREIPTRQLNQKITLEELNIIELTVDTATIVIRYSSIPAVIDVINVEMKIKKKRKKTWRKLKKKTFVNVG